MAKSIYLSYILWALSGPLFAIHHIYLGRDAQWFLWYSTFGGFLVGYLVDLCKLPVYVAQANRSPIYFKGWELKKGLKVREWQLLRWLGAYIIASYYELVCVLALDTYISTQIGVYWSLFLAKAIGRAIGIYLCFSVGLKKTSKRGCFISSILGECILRCICIIFLPERRITIMSGETNPFIFLLTQFPFAMTSMVAYWKQKYRDEVRRDTSCCHRTFILLVSSIIWTLLFLSAVYNHLEIPVSVQDPSETRMLKDIITDFLNSDLFYNVQSTVKHVRQVWSENGLRAASDAVLGHLGPILLELRQPQLFERSAASLYEISKSKAGTRTFIK